MGRLNIFQNGTKKSEKRGINFIDGTNTTVTVTDGAINDSVEVRYNATGGGGGDVATDAIWDAKGDLAAGTGANTATKLTVGADDTILMADAAVANGLKWVAAGSPSAVGTAAATGTADTFTRGDHVHAHEAAHLAHDTLWAAANDYVRGTGNDTAAVQTASAATPAAVSTSGSTGTAANPPSADDHVHAHEAAHINHDTTWAAKGDIIAGTANDTAAVLSAGSNGQIITYQSGQSTGLLPIDLQTNITFSKEGNLSTGTGTIRWYNDTGRTLTFVSVRASVGTAPATTSILIDVNIAGTTIFTTQGNRATVAAAANTGETTTFDVTTIADNTYLTVDIDQVGTGTVGADLSVQIWMKG